MRESTPTTILGGAIQTKLLMEIDSLLFRLQSPIRIPTARWLLSDAFGMIDAVANDYIEALLRAGFIKLTNGGWLSHIEPDRRQS